MGAKFDEDTAVRLIFPPCIDSFVAGQDPIIESNSSLLRGDNRTESGSAQRILAEQNQRLVLTAKDWIDEAVGRYALSGVTLPSSSKSPASRERNYQPEVIENLIQVSVVVPKGNPWIAAIDEMIDDVQDTIGQLRALRSTASQDMREHVQESTSTAHRASDLLDRLVVHDGREARRRELLLENYLDLMHQISAVQITATCHRSRRYGSARLRSPHTAWLQKIPGI